MHKRECQGVQADAPNRSRPPGNPLPSYSGRELFREVELPQTRMLRFLLYPMYFPCTNLHITMYTRHSIYVISELISSYSYNGLPIAFSILVVSSLFRNSSQRTLHVIAYFDWNSPPMCISMVPIGISQEWLFSDAVVSPCLLPPSAWPMNDPQNPERLLSQLVV